MNFNKTDSLGRATFHHIGRRSDVRPTEREIRWLKHIERHGPQSSEFLFELTRDTHCSKDTALRDMQKLRAAGFLCLPRQQRATERAEFKPYIYDLTRHARDYLTGRGLAEAAVRPTGHWWHSYTVSAFTGTLDIITRRRGREFIPGHKILELEGADFAIPVGGKRLIPDQLFAIRYPDGYRAFLLEVDRATEPWRSSAARKSLAQSIDLYSQIFANNMHRRHYGLNASMASLWVFSNSARLAAFQELARQRAGRSAAHFLSKALPDRLPWKTLEGMHKGPWVSGVGQEVVGL